jgi:NTE family protein
LAGAFIGAGYTSDELKYIMNTFDFNDINMSRIDLDMPVLTRYKDFLKETQYTGTGGVHYFLSGIGGTRNNNAGQNILTDVRGSILKNIVTFSKEGCLLDGDCLEQWVAETLQKKGIKTFADLRGGVSDAQNPSGYKVRMTAVDATRNKIVVLPDDIGFYGIKPDNLPVAKAVRMSTCVPFAFKPVELTAVVNGKKQTYNIIDGGVFDNFPCWLIDSTKYTGTVGFRLGGGKKKLLSVDTPVSIYKKLITSVQDIGIPTKKHTPKNIGIIHTGKVSFLDFNINDDDKNYLFSAGKKSALSLINKMNQLNRDVYLKKTGVISLFCALVKRAFSG